MEEVTRRREKNAYGKKVIEAITLIALISTTIFSYDENVKFSNNKVSSYNQFSNNHKFSNI